MKFMVRSALEGEDRYRRMAENIQREMPRLTPGPVRPGALVVCGYGPSLRETWVEIPKGAAICTTSGAHDFLIERDRIPRWHVEYDPRPHKLDFLRKPRRDVTYCLASTCYAEMFEQLKDYDVLLWHALGPDLRNDATLVASHEDAGILLLGGSNAGARAIMVGHALGWREFHLHGLDCSYRHDTIWAGPHSGQPHAAFVVECNGKKFLTSDIMINSAEELTHTILKSLAGCKFTIYGDGLLAERFRIFAVDQNRAKGQWWIPPKSGVTKVPVHRVPQIDALITDGYREQNAILHRFNPEYGSFGHRHAKRVRKIAEDIGTFDVLDYGCGKRALQHALSLMADEQTLVPLGFEVKNYDPALPEFSQPPEPADLVVCTDVMEHIEPPCVDAVIADLRRVTKKCLYLDIACRPAEKVLPDGRNAHLMIREAEWWEGVFKSKFDLLEVERSAGAVTMLCQPKG